MFERIKKVFAKQATDSQLPRDSVAPTTQFQTSRVSEWAGTQGFAFAGLDAGAGFALTGQFSGRPWRMEVGRPSREFIRGSELRARAELGVNEDAAVLVMNRPLKDALEKKAYSIYTDTLQTTADPNLPEEMRWLAMYEEVGWDALARPFWERYSVLADQRDNAMAFLDRDLADLMLHWPEPAPRAEVPFMMMILRGKAYLRMECDPDDLATLQHATSIFSAACAGALGGLSTDIAI